MGSALIEGKRKRVFSGVQPSGKLHIGNYIGALRQWVTMQDDYECIFSIVDLHALTIPEAIEPGALRAKAREVAALYVACGVDPERSTIFVQSEVAEHAELAWVLGCTTPLGWLERMTQFKVKSEGRETVGTGLLTYPVLQAADILLYDTDLVPIGEDQKQHVELTRDIAVRFNRMFGPVFVLPDVMVPRVGARIMGFDDPDAKMSKSTAVSRPRHAVALLDPPEQIRQTVMSAVTDSGCEVVFERASAGVKNLITVLAALSGEPLHSISERYTGRGYGYLKKDVADALVAALEPIQRRHVELCADPAGIDAMLQRCAARARAVASATMHRVRDAVGISGRS